MSAAVLAGSSHLITVTEVGLHIWCGLGECMQILDSETAGRGVGLPTLLAPHTV
jgi:hypothetical protein